MTFSGVNRTQADCMAESHGEGGGMGMCPLPRGSMEAKMRFFLVSLVSRSRLSLLFRVRKKFNILRENFRGCDRMQTDQVEHFKDRSRFAKTTNFPLEIIAIHIHSLLQSCGGCIYSVGTTKTD